MGGRVDEPKKPFVRESLLAIAASIAGASTVIALATIPDSGGVIHGCYKKSVGNLRVIDTSTDSCKPGEVAIAWSQRGPAGPQGTQGPQGPQGTSGLSHAYFVNDDPMSSHPGGLKALPNGYYTVSVTVYLDFPFCFFCIGAPTANCFLQAGGSQPFADGLLISTGKIFGGTTFAQASFTDVIHLTKGPSVNSIVVTCNADRASTAGQAQITALAVDALN
jgi:hypothetical protein